MLSVELMVFVNYAGKKLHFIIKKAFLIKNAIILSGFQREDVILLKILWHYVLIVIGKCIF